MVTMIVEKRSAVPIDYRPKGRSPTCLGANVKIASQSDNAPTNGTALRSPSLGPHIDLDDKAGTLRVNDARLFARERRAFCRRLAEAIASRPGVRKVMIDLASGSCRLEFVPRSVSRQEIAASFAESVREATASAVDALTAYALPGQVSLWETLEASPGRIRIRHQGLSGEFARLSQVADTLSRLDTVQSCKAIPWSHRLTIDFSPENGVADWFIDQAERAFESLVANEDWQAKAAMPLVEVPDQRHPIEVATGPKRWLYLALGGGSLVMTVVGLIVPGIPTVPFLLLSSYGFARSSPRINRWLRETRFFGPILIEWEQHGGLSTSSKKKLIGLTSVVVLVAIVLAPLSPLALGLILVMAGLSVYGVSRMPSAPDNATIRPPVGGTLRLALPAS
jgi:uncharacterized membrane protein YbaN (DUF454 family)